MTKLLKTLLLMIFLSAPLFGQGKVCGQVPLCSGTASAAADAVSLSLGHKTASAVVTISGTFSATLEFEQSNDGVTWASSTGYPQPSGSPATSATAAGQWAFSIPALSNFRVRTSSYASGSALIVITVSDAAYQPSGGSSFPVTSTVHVASGGNLTIDSGGTLTCASGSICPAGSGNVSNSGTPTANQWAQWVDATHIQGAALPTAIATASETSSFTADGTATVYNVNISGGGTVTLPTATGAGQNNGFLFLTAGNTIAPTAGDTVNGLTSGFPAYGVNQSTLCWSTAANTWFCKPPSVSTFLDTAASVTVDGIALGEFHNNQNATAATAITYTLPTAAAGLQRCFTNSNNGTAADTGTLKIATSATGQFIIDATGTLSLTGGYVISGGAAGDAACVVGVDATHWQLYVQKGTWTTH